MESAGYKHFSHTQNLMMHELGDGAEVSCTGCNSSATNRVYVCWQCNFFLHDQCFQATRSRKHPSHPHHPLTLVPYPTYPSNSFYCNSCNIIGTGFSYSCSECDFDLHVQCAYSISSVTSPHPHSHSQLSSMVPNVALVSINPIPINPITFQYPTTATQHSYMGQHVNVSSVSIPTGQKPKNQGFKHFSHPHGLVMVNLKHGKKQIACSGCQETLVGKGYACVEENCHFQLHESCFNLEKEIQHKSHPAHPLALDNKSGTFTCNACFRDGTGFKYRCSICEHDLHVRCATLKETVKRDDHEHLLELFYKCPLKGEEYTFFCDVCNRVVPPDHWTYYCKKCDYGTHLDCVERAACDKTKVDPVVDAITNLQRLQGALELIG